MSISSPVQRWRTRHRRRGLLVALVAGLGVLLFGAPALGQVPGQPLPEPSPNGGGEARQRWLDVAAGFEAAGRAGDDLFVAADAASRLSQEVQASGWHSARIPPLLAALIATANPGGGYGLARPWDAYQDGSVNSATTSYTATTVGHVGGILLAGFGAGVIPASMVNKALDWVLDLPLSADNPCIPYSDSPNDAGQPCVWNVHFGAAVWVQRASAATGYRPYDAAALVKSATAMLAKAPLDSITGYLPYASDQTHPQDIGHQLWTTTSIDTLRGGRQALDALLRGRLWRVQAQRFHDYSVASAMGGIALLDCRYATDPLVLDYAGSTAGGRPYAFKALAVQARNVAKQCFTPSGDAVSAPAHTAPPANGLQQPNLG